MGRGARGVGGATMSTGTMWSVGERSRLMNLDCAVELALEQRRGESEALEEFRPPEPEDFPGEWQQLAEGACERMSEWIESCDSLQHENGGASIDARAMMAAHGAAIAAMIAKSVDLSDAPWQPTGRTLTLSEAKTLVAWEGRR
jgi:hypothetical protein